MSEKNQSAQLKDGVSQSPLKGQVSKIENGNAMDSGMSALKKMRNTGEIKAGSSWLQSKQGGNDNSMKSE